MKTLFACFGIFLSGGVYLWACSCLPTPPPPDAFAKADAVFSGKVESIAPGGDHALRVTFRVQQSWKGTNAPTLVVQTASDSAMCGYNFIRGEHYLVYARVNGARTNAPPLATGLCGRNARLSDAAEDLQFLGPGRPPSGK